jgi:hypothetical protein
MRTNKKTVRRLSPQNYSLSSPFIVISNYLTLTKATTKYQNIYPVRANAKLD